MTSYMILKEIEVTGDDTREWREAGPPVEAVSAEAAIRKAIDGKGGTFQAVPLRSWSPVTVKVETVSKVTLA